MAIPFDTLGIACSEIANASERRTERMVKAFNAEIGLPVPIHMRPGALP